MNVEELIEELKKCDPKSEVIIENDEREDLVPLFCVCDDNYTYIEKDGIPIQVITRNACYDDYDFESQQKFREYLDSGVSCVLLVSKYIQRDKNANLER